ncbi:MAG: GtrA family protein [Bacteroidia bacterium]|nr:GtrA family protein [Bacteroidia bacterium]
MEKAEKVPFLKKYLGLQIVMFILIGGICYLIVMGLLILFVEKMNIEVNLANVIASLIVIFINYFLNAWFVFERGRHSRWKEFTGFFLFSMIGFGLNVILMYVLTTYTPIHYAISKTGITVAVAAFNFITRKLLIFKN